MGIMPSFLSHEIRSDGTYKITSFNFADNAIFYDTSQRWIRNVNFLNNFIIYA